MLYFTTIDGFTLVLLSLAVGSLFSTLVYIFFLKFDIKISKIVFLLFPVAFSIGLLPGIYTNVSNQIMANKYVETNIKQIINNFNDRCVKKYGIDYMITKEGRVKLNRDVINQYVKDKNFNPDLVKGIECEKQLTVN